MLRHSRGVWKDRAPRSNGLASPMIMPDALMGSGIAHGFAAIQQEISEAVRLSNRPDIAVRLIAVTKTQPIGTVREALQLGHRCFGENRVQEAQEKYPPLRDDYRDLSLHLIGPLQTNKVREAAGLFDVIETLDRPKLAEALANTLAKQATRVKSCLIQVNTGEEPQKAGVLPLEADDFIRNCRERLGLPIDGLMAIPPKDDEPAIHFALLREIARRHGLPVLSMGMSDDFRVAIQQGATHVRIGTALFGSRTAQSEH